MKLSILNTGSIIAIAIASSCSSPKSFTDNDRKLLDSAEVNGPLARQGFIKSTGYLYAWRDLADTATGLIPRNINDLESRDIWNAKDCAADNYPFMVLTSYFLDRPVFDTTMHRMLETEKKLTSRVGSLPDTWSFSKKGFLTPEPDMKEIIFGSAEYVKDGLIPITELLGKSPWSERMISILDDIWKNASADTPYGKIPSDDPEVCGDLLQALSRSYWFTGDKKYLDWAERLGDYYLLGNNHPTRNFEVLKLRDHGCEIVSGLCELYATVSFADKSKKEAYKAPLYEMLDRILEVGRNEDGLFYNSINPVTGVPVDNGIADTWGYTLDGFYTVYQLDNVEKYREPVIKVLSVLNRNYKNFAWEGRSADGYADAIESALNLYAREPVEQAREWIDSEIDVMWRKQLSAGIIEGWHGDGNFARTSLMYCFWKTGGTYVLPWFPYLSFGGVVKDGRLYLSARVTEQDWQGRIFFDTRRHSTLMNMPADWPRINQFPEYFTIDRSKTYEIVTNYKKKAIRMKGEELLKGLPVKINKDDLFQLMIQPL